MKRLILSGAVSGFALLVSACGGDRADEAADADAATAAAESETVAGAEGAGGAAAGAASADWPKGTRIVEEGGKTYRVGADGTRVAIENNEWRIVTEGKERYRVNSSGERVRISNDGIDIDLGTNSKGNLDLDVSTDGTDAKIED